MTTSPKDALELANALVHNNPNEKTKFEFVLARALISAHGKLEKATTALKFYEEACYIPRDHICERGINHVIEDKGICASEALKEIEG